MYVGLRESNNALEAVTKKYFGQISALRKEHSEEVQTLRAAQTESRCLADALQQELIFAQDEITRLEQTILANATKEKVLFFFWWSNIDNNVFFFCLSNLFRSLPSLQMTSRTSTHANFKPCKRSMMSWHIKTQQHSSC